MTDGSRRGLPPYEVRLARVAEADQICLVCADGFAASSARILQPETIRRQVYVLYLRTDVRGRGTGSALLDFVTDQQRRVGAREQWVSVTEGNDQGIPFYLARGFVERDRVPFVAEARSVRMMRPL